MSVFGGGVQILLPTLPRGILLLHLHALLLEADRAVHLRRPFRLLERDMDLGLELDLEREPLAKDRDRQRARTARMRGRSAETFRTRLRTKFRVRISRLYQSRSFRDSRNSLYRPHLLRTSLARPRRARFQSQQQCRTFPATLLPPRLSRNRGRPQRRRNGRNRGHRGPTAPFS